MIHAIIKRIDRTRIIEFLAFFFWYVALFPGRLGFDSSEAIRMIQIGESTDWWTAIFFWFMKISSIWGRSIFISSFLCLLILTFSLKFFIYSIPITKKMQNQVYIFILLTPLYGVFGLTVSHDVTVTSGILILIGIRIRKYRRISVLNNHQTFYYLCVIILLMTSKSSYLIIMCILISLILEKQFARAGILVTSILLIYFLSSIGITPISRTLQYEPFLADLKCIAQHPESRISEKDWKFLEIYAPQKVWKNPIKCSSMDYATASFPMNYSTDYAKFLTDYAKIAYKNPAIVIMTHIQRSNQALPPPFFQIPNNQVDLNTDNPIGLNSNIALQQGPEVLHPSIDEPSMKIDKGSLKLLESLALLPAFIINQASWFWGWGGLWLWPIFIILALKILKIRKFKTMLSIFYPIVIMHLTLFIIGPDPLPRYVMSTIFCGVISSILGLFKLKESLVK